MTPPSLHHLVDEYLHARRGLGFGLEAQEGFLRDFARHAERIGHSAAHRTGRADFPHPALGRDHAFAHGRLVVRVPRRVSPYSFQSRSSGNRT